MKKILLLIGRVLIVLLLVLVLVFLGSAFFLAQRADYGWDPAVARPHPPRASARSLRRGHHNASLGGACRSLLAIRQAPPRRRLLGPARDPGVHVRVSRRRAGARDRQCVGSAQAAALRHEPPGPHREETQRPRVCRRRDPGDRSWVERGGSCSSSPITRPSGSGSGSGSCIGVTMHRGFVEVPVSRRIRSSSRSRTVASAIIPSPRETDRGPPSGRVMTYTGQSLDGRPDRPCSCACRKRPSKRCRRATRSCRVPRPGARSGHHVGAGRIVVLGEAGMVTAQVSRRARYGMNAPDNDNRQFVLNVMHWFVAEALAHI